MGSRMYLALVPPAEVIEAVDDIIDEFSRRQHPHDPRKMRWARHGGAHITLAFMASVRDPEALLDAVSDELARVPPLTLGLSGAGAFPDPVSGRLLWLGVDDPRSVLPDLARTIRSAARDAGAHPEGGTFSPHVTLARCHRGDLTGEVDALSTFRTDTWLARTVSLIESVADSTGFHAQVVGEAVLNGLDWDQIRSPK